jgi:hypothetical protein
MLRDLKAPKANYIESRNSIKLKLYLKPFLAEAMKSARKPLLCRQQPQNGNHNGHRAYTNRAKRAKSTVKKNPHGASQQMVAAFRLYDGEDSIAHLYGTDDSQKKDGHYHERKKSRRKDRYCVND